MTSGAGKGCSEWTEEAVRQLVKLHTVVLFGRGGPDRPADGHTERALTILREYRAPFRYVDLNDCEVLAKLLVSMFKWSLPQVFINGVLVGGSDSLLQLHEDDRLTGLLQRESTDPAQEGGQ